MPQNAYETTKDWKDEGSELLTDEEKKVIEEGEGTQVDDEEKPGKSKGKESAAKDEDE